MTAVYGYLKVVKRNGEFGATCPMIERQIKVGTSAGCTLIINTPYVDQEHCAFIVKENNIVHVANLSTNEFVPVLNETPVINEMPLKHGDVIEIGGRLVRWEYPPNSRHAQVKPKTPMKKEPKKGAMTPVVSPPKSQKKLPAKRINTPQSAKTQGGSRIGQVAKLMAGRKSFQATQLLFGSPITDKNRRRSEVIRNMNNEELEELVTLTPAKKFKDNLMNKLNSPAGRKGTPIKRLSPAVNKLWPRGPSATTSGLLPIAESAPASTPNITRQSMSPSSGGRRSNQLDWGTPPEVKTPDDMSGRGGKRLSSLGLSTPPEVVTPSQSPVVSPFKKPRGSPIKTPARSKISKASRSSVGSPMSTPEQSPRNNAFKTPTPRKIGPSSPKSERKTPAKTPTPKKVATSKSPSPPKSGRKSPAKTPTPKKVATSKGPSPPKSGRKTPAKTPTPKKVATSKSPSPPKSGRKSSAKTPTPKKGATSKSPSPPKIGRKTPSKTPTPKKVAIPKSLSPPKSGRKSSAKTPTPKKVATPKSPSPPASGRKTPAKTPTPKSVATPKSPSPSKSGRKAPAKTPTSKKVAIPKPAKTPTPKKITTSKSPSPPKSGRKSPAKTPTPKNVATTKSLSPPKKTPAKSPTSQKVVTPKGVSKTPAKSSRKTFVESPSTIGFVSLNSPSPAKKSLKSPAKSAPKRESPVEATPGSPSPAKVARITTSRTPSPAKSSLSTASPAKSARKSPAKTTAKPPSPVKSAKTRKPPSSAKSARKSSTKSTKSLSPSKGLKTKTPSSTGRSPSKGSVQESGDSILPENLTDMDSQFKGKLQSKLTSILAGKKKLSSIPDKGKSKALLVLGKRGQQGAIIKQKLVKKAIQTTNKNKARGKALVDKDLELEIASLTSPTKTTSPSKVYLDSAPSTSKSLTSVLMELPIPNAAPYRIQLSPGRRASKRISSKNEGEKPDFTVLSPTALGLTPRHVDTPMPPKRKKQSSAASTPFAPLLVKSSLSTSKKQLLRRSVAFSPGTKENETDNMTFDYTTPNISQDVFVSPLTSQPPTSSPGSSKRGKSPSKGLFPLESQAPLLVMNEIAVRDFMGTQESARHISPKVANTAATKKTSNVKTPRTPYNDFTNVEGVANLLKTPSSRKSAKASGTPYNDFSNVEGVDLLLKTPKPQESPKKVPAQKKAAGKSPKNDLTDVTGVKRVFGRSPRNDLRRVLSIRRLMKTQIHGKKSVKISSTKVRRSVVNDLSDVEGVSELFGVPPVASPPAKRMTRTATGTPLRLVVTPVPSSRAPRGRKNTPAPAEQVVVPSGTTPKARAPRARKVTAPTEDIVEVPVQVQNAAKGGVQKSANNSSTRRKKVETVPVEAPKAPSRQMKEKAVSFVAPTRRKRAATNDVTELSDGDENKPRRGRAAATEKEPEKLPSPPKKVRGTKKTTSVVVSPKPRRGRAQLPSTPPPSTPSPKKKGRAVTKKAASPISSPKTEVPSSSPPSPKKKGRAATKKAGSPASSPKVQAPSNSSPSPKKKGRAGTKKAASPVSSPKTKPQGGRAAKSTKAASPSPRRTRSRAVVKGK